MTTRSKSKDAIPKKTEIIIKNLGIALMLFALGIMLILFTFSSPYVKRLFDSLESMIIIFLFVTILFGVGFGLFKYNYKIIQNKKEILINLSLLVISLTFSMVLIDVCLFFLLPQNVIEDSKYSWDEPAYVNKTFEVLDLDLSKHLVNYITYERGFKRFSTPDSNKIKILVLGDSFTKAGTVSNGEEYYAYLERNPEIQLFAKGVMGWGTLQEYLFLNETYDSIKPDIIILQFSSNDFINNDYFLEKNSFYHNNEHLRPYLEDNQIVYKDPTKYKLPEVIKRLRITKFLSYKLRTLLMMFRRRTSGTVEDEINEKGEEYLPFAKSVNTTSKIMNMIKSVNPDTKVFAFIFDQRELNTTSSFEKIMKENNIEVIHGVTESVIKHSKDICVYNSDSLHWNKEGHRLAGMVISNYINDYLDKNIK